MSGTRIPIGGRDPEPRPSTRDPADVPAALALVVGAILGVVAAAVGELDEPPAAVAPACCTCPCACEGDR